MKRLRYFLGSIILMMLGIAGCFDMPEDLILPEWDVDLNLPLTNKTYTIYDLFKPEAQNNISTTLTQDKFYLIQSEEVTNKSDVAQYLDFSDQLSVSQNIILPTNLTEAETFLLYPNDMEIEQAVFKSGYLAFAVNNLSPSPTLSQLYVPGVKKPDGSELRIECLIEGFAKDSIVYDLSGHEYSLPTTYTLENKKGLQLIASATSSISGTFESINSYLSNLAFESATGSIKRKSLGNKSFSSLLELNDAADFRGKLFVKEASLRLQSFYVAAHQNPFDFEVSNVQITGVRNDGLTKNLTKNGTQNLTLIMTNGYSILDLDENNSNITDFVNFLPDSVVIKSEFILNPSSENKSRTVTKLDSVKFSVQFAVKSIFAIKQTNFVDTLEIDLDKNTRDQIAKGVGSDLNIQIENAIPLDAFVKATVLDESYKPLFVLTRNQFGIDSLQFLGGQVNGSTGQIISPTITLNTIALNSNQISQLAKTHHIIFSTTINTTNAGNSNPPLVQFRSSDWLKLKCYGKVKYHVSSEEK